MATDDNSGTNSDEEENLEDYSKDSSPEDEFDGENDLDDYEITIKKLLPRTFSFDQNYFIMTKIELQYVFLV